MTEYKCGSAETCQFGEMCKPNYDIGGCYHFTQKKPQTNEEWFCGLSTEEKAKFMCNIYEMGKNEKEYFMRLDKCVEWLKEMHNEKHRI